MIQKKIAFFFLLFASAWVTAQTLYGVAVPDSIKKSAESIIISEIGPKAFQANVKYIKGDAHTHENVLKAYTLFYSFNFPNVNESHVIFNLEYKLSPDKNGIIKDVAFKNYTRLPAQLKTKPAKIIGYEAAKKIALQADTTLIKFKNNLYHELSTDYNETTKDYFFIWYFYYIEPCKKCEAEMYTTHSVFIDAVTGKVIRNAQKSN